MKRALLVGLMLATPVLSGCDSAHIKDVYLSLDDKGVRRTSCVNSQAQQYHLFIEYLSFREDTLVWPALSVVEAVDEPDDPPFTFKDDELAEFSNWAPGKGEGELRLFLERDLTEVPPPDPFKRGRFRLDVFLNDESAPRKSLVWDIDSDLDKCPITVIPNTY